MVGLFLGAGVAKGSAVFWGMLSLGLDVGACGDDITQSQSLWRREERIVRYTIYTDLYIDFFIYIQCVHVYADAP